MKDWNSDWKSDLGLTLIVVMAYIAMGIAGAIERGYIW
jgi:hypothetical protein